jgi:quercetin dioxygenase-like cupin family protein
VGDGFGVVGLDDLPWTRHTGETAWATLTAALGATETQVDAVRLGVDDAVRLPVDPEQLLVVLAGAITVTGVDPAVAHPGLALVPAGGAGQLETADAATVLVVRATADADPDAAPCAVDLDAVPFEVPSTSDVATAFLTGPLGCAGMKVNARRLEPGQAVPYHTEGDQEELFVPVVGPASMRIDDASFATPPGTVARVAPDVPRSAVNDGDTETLWVMVGAPPTGGPTDWDPGAEILE